MERGSGALVTQYLMFHRQSMAHHAAALSNRDDAPRFSMEMRSFIDVMTRAMALLPQMTPDEHLEAETRLHADLQ